jgi:hypothetical protein
VASVGSVLLAAMVYTGAHNLVQAWPVSSYPDFRGVSAAERNVVSFEIGDASGRTTRLELPEVFGSWTTPDRYESLVGGALNTTDPTLKARRAAALWSVARSHVPTVRSARSVEVRIEAYSTDPDRRGEAPLAEYVMYAFTLTGPAAQPTLVAEGQTVPIPG